MNPQGELPCALSLHRAGRFSFLTVRPRGGEYSPGKVPNVVVISTAEFFDPAYSDFSLTSLLITMAGSLEIRQTGAPCRQPIEPDNV